MFAVFNRIQTEGTSIHNALEFIFNEDGIVQRKFTLSRLFKDFNHHRSLHGAGGMEGFMFSD